MMINQSDPVLPLPPCFHCTAGAMSVGDSFGHLCTIGRNGASKVPTLWRFMNQFHTIK